MAIKKIKLPGMAQPIDIGTTWANVSDKPDLMTSSEINAAINAAFATNDAMVFKGTIGAGGTVTQLPATHEAGWTYKVISNGSLVGQPCEVGDMIVCIADGEVATADDWTVIQTNVDGTVTGPASSTAGHIAVFTGTTGKAIQDSGYAITDFATSDIITISSTQPTNSDNKIWISSTSENGVQVPTVAEALSLGITGATAGQMIAIDTVNEAGAPTSWATTTLSNLPAAESGTATSLVTTGDKYNWNNSVVISDTQPTGNGNKLWVDEDAGSGNSYQMPTVTEMQAADNSILGNLAMIESSPVTQAHAIGDFIVYNGQLYKVTVAISTGESLTMGTNVESTTVGEELKDEYEFGTIASESFGRLYYEYSQKKKILWLTWYGNEKTVSAGILDYYLPSHIIPARDISFLTLTKGWLEIYHNRKISLHISGTYAYGTGCFPTQ